MKHLCAIAVFAVSLGLIGCGGPGEPSNIMEGVQQSEVDAYNAMLAADEAAMAEEDASGGTGAEEAAAAAAATAAEPAAAEAADAAAPPAEE